MSSSEYEVRDPPNQRVELQDGDVLENVIYDFSNGGWVTIGIPGSNVTVRNVGFRGTHSHDQNCIVVHSGGNVLIENVYMGDGCIRPSSYSSHGQVGIFVHRSHSGHVEIRNCNIQDWPNNGIYASAPEYEGGGTVEIRDCYAANNYVSCYRIATQGSGVYNCIGHNNGGRYNGRIFWGWGGGPYEIRDCDFHGGSYGDAIHVDRGGSHAVMSGTQHTGTHTGSGDTIENEGGNGNNPDLNASFAVPTSPEQAASGNASGTPQPPGNADLDLDSTHVLENVHVSHVSGNTSPGVRALNGEITVRDSEIEGPNPRVTESGGEIDSDDTNWGNSANASPPDGVPLTATEASGEVDNASDPP